MGRWAFLAALTAFVPAVADDAPPPIRPFSIETVEKLGRAMYEQDQLVWHASDIMTAQYSVDELKARHVHLWVVDLIPGGWVVRFTANGPNGPEVFCEVAYTPDIGKSCDRPVDRSLSPDDVVQFTARDTALANITRSCSQRYNTIVLKDPERDDWLVWAMAATDQPGVVVYGGHYRFTISKDGKTVVQSDALSRGCFNTTPPPAKGDEKVAALFFTQLVAPIPVETTVFLSLQHHLPIFIGTGPRTIYEVHGDVIEEIKNSAPPV